MSDLLDKLKKTTIIFEKFRDNAVIPSKATIMSGGYDVTAAHVERVNGSDYKVYLGLGMQPPPGYRIRMAPRSSITKTTWVLQNTPALGDADYLGEYILRFKAIPSEFDGQDLFYDPFPYNVGDRVAQMWVEKEIELDFVESDLPNITTRVGGFGSTGI